MANILIVDDSRTSRKILRTLIESQGHTVVGEGKNGQEGVQLFQQLKPDLVTMDITMPILDGAEAMKMIRALSSEVKIVMITAAGQRNKIIECLRDGANEFLTKPLDENEVKATIDKVLNS